MGPGWKKDAHCFACSCRHDDIETREALRLGQHSPSQSTNEITARETEIKMGTSRGRQFQHVRHAKRPSSRRCLFAIVAGRRMRLLNSTRRHASFVERQSRPTESVPRRVDTDPSLRQRPARRPCVESRPRALVPLLFYVKSKLIPVQAIWQTSLD